MTIGIGYSLFALPRFTDPGRCRSVFRILLFICVTATVCAAASVARAGALLDTLRAVEELRCDTAVVADEGRAAEQIAALARSRCYLRDGDFDAAIEYYEQARSGGPWPASWATELPWLPELDARVMLLRGEPDASALAFDTLIDRATVAPTSRATRARLLYYAGLAWQAAGSDTTAALRWERLANEVPSSEYVSRIWLSFPRVGVSSPERVELAARALAGRHYEAADRLLLLAACAGAARCSPYEAARSGDAARYEAVWQLGFLRYRFRRELVAEALVWLEAVAAIEGPRQADAAFTRARAMHRLSRTAEARRAWADAARRFPQYPDARDAATQIAGLLLEDGALPEARAAYDAIAEASADPAARRTAIRWAAWASYRDGDCDAAIARWQRLVESDGALWRGQALYWIGVCLERSGNPEAARASWRQVVELFPVHWYAMLARRRLGDSVSPPARSPAAEPSDRVLRIAAELGRAGFDAEARALIAASPQAEAERMRLDAVAEQTLAIAVEPGPATWRARRVENPQAGAPDTLLGSFPPFWEQRVDTTASEHGLPGALIHGIIQQESNYDRRALSVSDAMGLMQVIPQTALQISIALQVAYVDGDLFEPATALRFGGWYLGALYRKFGEQYPLAVIAYNAGPVLVERWLDNYGDAPLDEFVESIPGDQARDYLKRVTTIAYGRALAAGDAALLQSDDLGGLLPATIRRGYDDSVQF